MIVTLSALSITTLGRFEVRRDNEPISGGSWNRRKVRELFKLLLSADQHRLHREQIQEILWPSSSAELAANSFGKTLYLLRRAFEPELPSGKGAASNYVVLERDIVLLVPEHINIDADRFEAEVKQLQSIVRSHLAKNLEQQLAEIIALLDTFDEALSLYGGDYLPDDIYEDWAQRRRDRLHRMYGWLLENAADRAVAAGLGLQACSYLQSLLEQDMADEQAHRQLMILYARMGRRNDALNQYQLLRDTLKRELGTKPLPETLEALRRIQAGRIPVDLTEPSVVGSKGGASAHPDEFSHIHSHAPSDPHLQEGTIQKEMQYSDERADDYTPAEFHPERVLQAELVEREEEMRLLRHSFQLLKERGQHVFFVSGEAGIGKTRLAHDFTRWAESTARALVLWGNCYEMEGMLPYQPVADAIAADVRTREPAELERMLSKSAADLAKIVPDIRTKLPQLPVTEAQGSEVERRNLYNAVACYLDALARTSPLIVVVDDIQWADSATMQLLNYLTQSAHMRERDQVGPLYLLLYRADEVHEQHPLRSLMASLMRRGSAEEIRLKRLSVESAHQLLMNIAGHAVGPVFTEEIYRYTEGDPFFIGEALITLVQEGRIRKVDGRWQVTVELDKLALPQNVRLLIERRLSRLSPECRLTLVVAAILGRQFSSTLLCKARGQPEDVVAEHIDQALQLQLLTLLSPAAERDESASPDRDNDLSFSHDKIREVLAQWLNPLRRRAVHRQVALAIEELYAKQLRFYYGRLAYHYQQAEDIARTVDYHLQAAQQAAGVYAFVEAANHMENALALLIGDEDRPRRAELLRQLGTDVYLYIGRPDKAIESGLASCALWRDLGERVKEAEASLDVAFSYHWMGKEDEATRFIQRALSCLEEHPEAVRLRAKAYAQWGLTATNLGDTATACQRLEEAERLHEQIGGQDPFIGVVTLWARSWCSFLMDSPRQMLVYALQSVAFCREKRMFAWEPMMTYTVAWAYMLLGNIEAGAKKARETLEQAQRHNVVGAQGWAYLVLAFLAIQTAEWDQAEQYAARASEIAALLHDADLQSRVLWGRSVCSGWRGQWENAIDEVLEALRLCEQDAVPSMVYPYLLLQAAKAYYFADKQEPALSYLQKALQVAEARGYRQLPAQGKRLWGRILHAQGDFEAARMLFEQALAAFDALEDVVEYARTQEAYGLLCAVVKDDIGRSLGRQLVEQARTTYGRLGING